jgi:RNA polymerase sigma-70 factor (ECF subfamily)
LGLLVRLFRSHKNDKQQFMTLLRPHIELMYRMAWRWTRSEADAEDLVQDVLIKLIGRGEEMAAVEKLRPWLIKIVYHRYVDLYRSTRNSPLLAQATSEGNADDDNDGNPDFFLDVADDQDEIARLQLRDSLQQALDQLEAPHRDVIMLHDAEGYSDQETAAILGISIGTVKSRLHRARAKLKIFIEQGTN